MLVYILTNNYIASIKINVEINFKKWNDFEDDDKNGTRTSNVDAYNRKFMLILVIVTSSDSKKELP